MNKQEIFNKVATHLFEQGVQSSNEDGMCLYRGPNDTKCAVGCLIEDKDYDESMEGEAVNTLTLPDNLKTVELELLRYLQACHDTSYYWNSTFKMKNSLQTVGELYRLDTSILDTLSFKDR